MPLIKKNLETTTVWIMSGDCLPQSQFLKPALSSHFYEFLCSFHYNFKLILPVLEMSPFYFYSSVLNIITRLIYEYIYM